MKKSLNCDQVFDVLTRGPFPTGDAIDRDVERHLGVCHECRALAEALRPAIELFHESIDPEESRDLPGYHGATSPSSGGLAQMVAQAIDSDLPPQTAAAKVSRPSTWAKVAAYRPSQLEAFLAALAIGALFVLSLSSFDGWNQTSHPLAASNMPTHEGLVQLTSLELRPSCFAWTPGSAASALHCCTECHAATGERSLSKPAVAVVAASCRACHP